MILSFVLDFNSRDEMEQVANKLWKQHRITGEMEMIPLPGGRWRLSVHSEKQLRQSTIDSLPGKRTTSKLIGIKMEEDSGEVD
ncbi:MAG: hypothetical protein GX165_00725 [Firmicutes bacterium]|jgi:hypothetical protein|nr:hypothetical protein [Bacillota bacterium]